MPKTEAAKQERLLLREYEQSKERDSRSLKVYKEKNIKRFEMLKIEINKADDPMTKLSYALEIIGIITGDDSFMRINLK